MHGKAIAAALFALAVGASAQTPIAPDVQQSVLLVLATAIPSDVASYAIASSSAFAEEMASSLAAGKTPAWYQALPTDVLSLLPQIYPSEAEATPTPSSASASMYETSAPSSAAITPSASASASAYAVAPIASGSSALTGVNSVNSTSHAVQTPTLSASASAATFTGAAAFPTAAVGASVGAVLGFIGMLAL